MECTPATIRDYKGRLRQFLRFLYVTHEGLSLTEVDRQHVESYLVSFHDAGRSSFTMRTQYRCLSAFYHWLVTEQFIEQSPLRNIKIPRVPKRSKAFLSEAEFQQLLSFCPLSTYSGARAAAVLWLLWSTGMRLSELANLQVTDLDADRNRIKLFGKGRKERFVPYSKEARKAVWRYLAYRDDKLPQLWLSEERKPIKGDGLRLALIRLYQRAGIHVKDTCHVFRRTWAMRNLKAGVPIKYVCLVGGWEQISTLEGYVRAMQSDEALDAKWA
jgi:site-specific recombinase XerD